MGLSPWEIVSFLPKTGLLLSSLATTALASPFRGNDQAKSLAEHIRRNALRAAFDTFNVGQLQVVLPPTEVAYLAENKKVGEPAVVVDPVPNTTIKGFWVGGEQGDRSKATTYLVFYHGGGFVLPASDGHIKLLWRIVKWSGGKIAIFVPDYSLSPPGYYPTPIKEAVESVKYVAGLAAAENKELALAGDSAGGALLLAVLSLAAGHPLKVGGEVAVEPFELPTLKSALAIAPWVSSDYKKFPQMVSASRRDILSHKALQYWSSVYKGTRTEDGEFIAAEETDAAWWEPVRGKVNSVLVLTGEDEVLKSPIVSWYEKFEKGFGAENSRLLVAKNEIHDHPLVPKSEAELDAVGDAETQEGAIKRWAQELAK